MHSIFFWKDWPKNYKALWFLLSGIFLMSLLFMWFTWFQGAHGIIHWEKLQEQEIIETTVHQFRLGPFQLNVPGESYVIFEYLQGSNVEHNKVASYIFLAVLISSSMVMLTIITTLRKFWYFIGIALFVVFVMGLRLEVLVVFVIKGYAVPVVILVIFAGLSYYFKSFSSATFSQRLMAFTAVAAVFGFIVAFFSHVPYPFLHLVTTA